MNLMIQRLFFSGFLLVSCVLARAADPAQGQTSSSSRFDSDASICLDGEIRDMVLLTQAKETEDIHLEIYCQLFFLTGLLNQYEASADISQAVLTVHEDEARSRNGYRELRYSANFLVAWPRKQPVPASLPVALPRQADEDGMQHFFDAYHKDCCKDSSHPDLNFSTYYYYYRPGADSCPILRGRSKPNIVSYGAIILEPSKKQSYNKYPEYHKVWEDGKLVATAIFGLSKPEDPKLDDQGIAAYNLMYKLLQDAFGKPQKIKPAFVGLPGKEHPDVEMEWDKKGVGKININILLNMNKYLEDVSSIFKARYDQRTRISDFISYNGHSGYGTNISTLATMGTFTPGQWQLFYINGCHSFCYFHEDLDVAHQLVNPGSEPYEFLDIITNSMPAYFMNNAPGNMTILTALVEQKKTYRQIFEFMEQTQKPCVMGEENNSFGR